MVKFVRIDTFQKVKDFVNLMQDIKEDTVYVPKDIPSTQNL